MRVECVRLFNVHRKEVKYLPHLKIGNQYEVLGIESFPNSGTHLRILSDDDGTPFLGYVGQFKLVDSRIQAVG